MKVVRPSACVLLTGCPYIFGPPDLSRLAEPTAASVPDTSLATDAEPDVDTATTTDVVPPPRAPKVVQFEPIPELDQVTVLLAILEGDAPLLGGTVEVTAGEYAWSLRIPQDFSSWNPLGTSVAVIQPYALLPCAGYTSDLFVTVTDSASVRSAVAVENVTISGLGVLPEQVDDTTVDPPTATWTACVSFESDVPLTGDVENVSFTADASGAYSVWLAGEGEVDLDFAVEDGSGLLLGFNNDFGYDFANVVVNFEAGSTYTIETRYWSDASLNPPYLGHLFVRLEE